KTLLTLPVRRAVPKRSVSRRLALELLEARDVPSISLQAAGNYSTGGYSLQSVATRDLNHDGAPHLATLKPRNPLGRPSGPDPGAYSVGTNARAVSAGDFNGDGKPDLAVANDVSLGSVFVLPGAGDGTFGAPISYAVGDSPYLLTAGDFNGDSRADLAVGDG